MTDFDKRKAFITTTELHAAEGEMFGLTREQIAKTMLGQAVWMYIDTLGHDATIAALERYVKFAARERDEGREV